MQEYMAEKGLSEHFYAVIMAGGGGSRLWPVSRKRNPKQLLRLSGRQSLFQMAVNRLQGLFSINKIFVVTIQEQVAALRTEVPQIPLENYIIEPLPRGTASVVGLAANHLFYKDDHAVMAVLTADHVIENVPLFQTILQCGSEVAKFDYLVTIGIEPTYPSTGYGYIEMGHNLEGMWGQRVAHIKRFVEKPNEENANLFIKNGGYLWNSGMFIWKASQIIKEFQNQMPVLAESLDVIASSIGTHQYKEILEKIWEHITPQTIDYGIMEHASNVVVIPSQGLGWSDIGSWDSLIDIIEPDESGNIVLGDETILINTHNTIIKKNDSTRLLAAVGLNDIVIIDTEDALLVCKKGETQNVRHIVNMLKEKNLDKFL